MLVKHRVALSVSLLFLTCLTAQGRAMAFGGWGKANYEKPAPTPVAAPVPTVAPIATTVEIPAKTKAKRPAHERAASVPQSAAPKVIASHEVPPAPTPQPILAADATAKSGPIEPGAPTIRDLVSKHARANGIPEKLAAAVVDIESRFNPKARGGSALGLMQIKYDTARSMGYAGGVTALMAPDTNLHFGMKVLADAYKASSGDICMTLARYQSGHRVTKASTANRAYCARARTFMARSN